MDTENFLLEREQLLAKLSNRRSALLRERAEMKGPRFLGLGWSDWLGLLAGGVSRGGASRRAFQFLIPTLVPWLFSFARSKAADFSAKNARWYSFSDLLSSLIQRYR